MHLTGKQHTKSLIRFFHFPTLCLSLCLLVCFYYYHHHRRRRLRPRCCHVFVPCRLSSDFFVRFLSLYFFKSPFYSDL